MSLASENERLDLENSQQIVEMQKKKDLRPRLNIFPGIFQEYKRTYVKVPQDSKDQLSRLVFKEGFKIKEAAKRLKIKYATAKTIIFHLREERKQGQTQGYRMCHYTELSGEMISKFKIISQTSQEDVTSREYQYSQEQLSLLEKNLILKITD